MEIERLMVVLELLTSPNPYGIHYARFESGKWMIMQLKDQLEQWQNRDAKGVSQHLPIITTHLFSDLGSKFCAGSRTQLIVWYMGAGSKWTFSSAVKFFFCSIMSNFQRLPGKIFAIFLERFFRSGCHVLLSLAEWMTGHLASSPKRN